MPRYIQSLQSFATMATAYAALVPLYDLFKKEHGRGEKVELFLSSTSKPEKRATLVSSFAPQSLDYEIRCHYNTEDVKEMEWFRKKLER